VFPWRKDFLRHLIISKIKRLNPTFILGLFLFVAAPNPSAFADSPNIVNIGVAIKGNYVVMNARLINGFTEKISEAIESGVPMGFTFEIELRKENTVWVDSLVRSNTIRHKIQFDPLKKAYRFSEVGKNVRRKVVTHKMSRYQKLMLTLKDIPIAPIFSLNPDEKYYVRVKADLETDRFWFPFNYIFFLVPFSDFETSWAQTSSLSIDPDLELSKQAADKKSRIREGKVSKDVIRSFNK
jgi:hypothetical protein